MSFTQFRTDVKRKVNRRRTYARINALPQSTVRNTVNYRQRFWSTRQG